MFQAELGLASGGGIAVQPNARSLALPRFKLPSSARFADLDLTVDLGDRIGSRPWWLGAAALLSLTAAALALGTLVPALPQRGAVLPTPSQQELAKAEALAPLALGATTGRATFAGPLVERLSEAPERPRVQLTAKVSGGGLLAALRRAGVGKDDLDTVTGLLRREASAAALPPKTELDIVLGRRETRSVPRPLETLGFRSAFDMRLAVARTEDGSLELKRIPIAVDATPLRVAGAVGGNLGKAARTAGLPADLAAEAVKQLGYAIDFQHGIGRRDRFDIIVEHKRAETGDEQWGGLLYAALAPAGKDRIELARFDYGGKPQFFRASGESARKGLMRTPVDGARLTSTFGMRFHPVLNYSRMHQGVDFGAATGSPVLAAAGGKVTFAGVHGGHGNYIMVQHTRELATAYGHLSKFAVRNGQSVSQGQVIGYVGSTGLSTGPHLHYEVWLRGAATNPQSIKFTGGTQLAGGELAKFQGVLARLRAL